MAEHWQSLVANLAVVALFISAWANGHFVIAGQTRRGRNLALGAVIGLGAVASMMLTVPLDGAYFDLRLSLVAIAGFFGGPLAALVAVVIALAYRTFLGGPALLSAATSIVFMAAISVVLSRVTRKRIPALYSSGLLAGAVAGVSLGLTISYFGTLSPLSIGLALANGLATALGAFFMMRSRVQDRERNLFRAAFIQSPDFQYVKTPEIRFAAVNLGVVRINGFASPAEMIGKTDLDLVPEDRARILMEGERRVLETGKPLLDVEELVIDRGGDEIWYLTSKVPLFDEDGETIGLAGSTRDITTARRLRMEVAEGRNQLNYVLTEITDGIARFDRQGTLAYCNEQYRILFPLTANERRSGQHIRDILHAVVETKEQRGIPQGGEEAWIDSVVGTLSVIGEQEIELFDGRWLLVRTRPTADGSALVVVSDVTRIKRTETALRSMTEQLKLLATTDGLTGLTNRRAFDQALESEVARHRRSRLPLALLMIDVDRFKAYNDTYGHLEGDLALKAVATCLQRTLKRPTDIAARYGGEEFVAILPGTDEDGAFFIADEFRENLQSMGLPHSGCDKGVLTASVGLAVLLGGNALEPTELLRRADEALYSAKEAGRNRVTGWRQKYEVRAVKTGD